MEFEVTVYVKYCDEDYFDFDYQEERGKPFDYEELLNNGAKYILNWFKKVIEDKKYNITDVKFDSVYIGSEGIGDAYVGGGYQAVDIDNPSHIYFTMTANNKRDVERLVNYALKHLKEDFEKHNEDLFLCNSNFPGEYPTILLND